MATSAQAGKMIQQNNSQQEKLEEIDRTINIIVNQQDTVERYLTITTGRLAQIVDLLSPKEMENGEPGELEPSLHELMIKMLIKLDGIETRLSKLEKPQ